LLFRGVLRIGLPDDLAPSENSDPIGYVEDLTQLVGDEDDPLARLLQPVDDLEELFHLLRGEYGRGLVEDDDLGVTEQNLDDLDPLLDADWKVLDDGLRIDEEPVFAGDLLDLLARLFHVDRAHRLLRRLHAEHHVLRDGEHRHQHEVLVDHPDACVDRVARVREVPDRAVDDDLTLVGRVEAVEDVHQGGLPRSVLTEEPEDLARLDCHVD